MFEAMLSGWRAQQAARGLREDTVADRERLVRRFGEFAGEYPWAWSPGHVDEWSLYLTAEEHLAPSTSFPMRRAFPGSEYYGGSAPPGPFSGRRACPGQRAGCPPPGTSTGRFPCSLLPAQRIRSPAVSQQHRHEYAAGLPHGLPVRLSHTSRKFPPPSRAAVRAAPGPDPPGSSRRPR
jgi:hypothetical protein